MELIDREKLVDKIKRKNQKVITTKYLVKFLEEQPNEASENDFGAVLVCATRYCMADESYIADIVIGFIKRAIPSLSNEMLTQIDQAIDQAYHVCHTRADMFKWLDVQKVIIKDMMRRRCGSDIVYGRKNRTKKV